MAWRSSGRSNSDLLLNLTTNGLLTSSSISSAMHKVDRGHYVLPTSLASAYADSPQPIGYGATISAPHMHVHAFENLSSFLQPGKRVLDVGGGSGYCLAVFHHLVSPQGGKRGKVVGIEHIGELVDWSKENLAKDGLKDAVDEAEIEVVKGDGRAGCEQDAPFDAIHVGAAAPVMPQALIHQLNRPGRMFIPVNSEVGYGQDIWQVDKDRDGKVTQTKLFGVNYVPLTDETEQRP